MNIGSLEQPRAGSAVMRATLTLGAVLVAHTLLETARDAMFLEGVPLVRLPWMYLALAAISLVVAAAPRRDWVRSQTRLAMTLVGAALVTAGFWAFGRHAGRPLLYALYLWAGVCGSTAVSFFWATIATSFSLADAKRSFGVIGFGGVGGGVLGAAFARAIFAFGSPRSALLASALVFVCAATLSLTLPTGASAPTRRSRAKDDVPETQGFVLRVVRNDPYLRGIASIAVLSAVTLTFLDYAFKRALILHTAPAALPHTLANIALVTNALGAAVQLFGARPSMRWLGITGTLIVLPAFLTLGAVFGVASGALFAFLAMRIFDGAFRYSLYRTSMELLFVPIAESVRNRVKTALDALTQRGGQALASVLIVWGLRRFDHARVFSLVILVGAAAWMARVLWLRGPHRALFRSTLDAAWLETRAALPDLDGASVELLVEALGSDQANEVIGAMELLAARGKERLIPRLVLLHEKREVVIAALEIFRRTARTDVADAAYRLVGSEHREVRTTALRVASSLAFDEQRVRSAIRPDDLELSAVAYVELAAHGCIELEQLSATSIAGEPIDDRRRRLAAVRALATTHAPMLMRRALPLVDAEDPELRLAAVSALANNPLPEAIPSLLRLLGDREAREPARRALVALGPAALDALERALGDASVPRRIRVHLPRTISRFSPHQSLPILLAVLDTHPETTVRYKALRGLGRIVAIDPSIRIDQALVSRVIHRELHAAERARSTERAMSAGTPRAARPDSPARALLLKLLAERFEQALERVFRLIGLLVPEERWDRIHEGLRSTDRRVRDSSRELVAELTPEPFRIKLTELVEEDTGRADASWADEVTLLRHILAEGSSTLAELIAHYAAEARLVALAPALAELRPREQEIATELAEVVEHALATLRGVEAKGATT
jgi:AAA family ATP:ADP antiporter